MVAIDTEPVQAGNPRALLGFRDGINGTHAARTMMLADIQTLFGRVPLLAPKAEYAAEVVAGNCLAKPTKKARELSFQHLVSLYGLDPQLALFRVFRRLWEVDPKARPVLALCAALARDPLLRGSISFITTKQPGEAVTREALEAILVKAYPDRFSPVSLTSFAQNINGTWTQAGFLTGRSRKKRTVPVVTDTNVVFALFLGYLEGLSGQRLFTSSWMQLLGCTPMQAEVLATTAAHQELIVFLNAGGVKEIRFPGYLTEQEETWRFEVSNV